MSVVLASVLSLLLSQIFILGALDAPWLTRPGGKGPAGPWLPWLCFFLTAADYPRWFRGLGGGWDVRGVAYREWCETLLLGHDGGDGGGELGNGPL